MNATQQQLDMTTTYQTMIKELNEIIRDLSSKNSNLSKENAELKKQLEDHSTTSRNLASLKFITMCISKYTAYMVSNVILDRFGIKLSSRYIVKIATENNFFEKSILALRIPRKEGSSDKYASTVIFSTIGVLKMIDILHDKYVLNKNIKKDHLEISLQQYREGKGKEFSIKELRNMEK